jgi:capsular polysaccharide export protein
MLNKLQKIIREFYFDRLSRFRRARRMRKNFLKAGHLKGRMPVEIVGNNWRSNAALPIAILFGFHPWKRQFVSSYLKEFKTAFAHTNNLWRIWAEFVSHFPSSQKFVIIVWGRHMPLQARAFLLLRAFSRRPFQLYRIEDGFLRSMGSAVLHTRPSSLCIDDIGIYFDPRNPSRLEELVRETHEIADPALVRRSQEAILRTALCCQMH